MTASAHAAGSLGVLGHVAKATALLAAGGYIALRAHHNQLGISGPAFLGAERYLMEAYFLVVALFEIVVWLILPALCLVAAGAVLRRKRARAGVRCAPRLWRAARRATPLLPLLFLGLLLGLLMMASIGDDLLVGDLRQQAVPARKPALFSIAVLAAACWQLLVYAVQQSYLDIAEFVGPRMANPLAGIVAAVITLAYAVALPLFYGLEVHPVRYPLARVTLVDATQPLLCGIVVLHWDEGMMLWRVTDGKGRLTSVSNERVAAVDWGQTRDVVAALSAKDLQGEMPDCSKDFPGRH